MSAPTVKELIRSINRGLVIDGEIIPPLSIVAARINTLGTGVSSFEDPLRKAIKEIVIPSIKENFLVGGRPPWEPHAEATAEISQRMGNPAKAVLVRSGNLATYSISEDAWAIDDGSASFVGFPTNLWYGTIQQEGYEGKGGGQSAKGKTFKQITSAASLGDAVVPAIPARPFIVLQPEDEEAISEVFMEWLGDEIERAYPV